MRLMVILLCIFALAFSGCVSTDELPVEMNVVDTDGVPISGARVTFVPQNVNFVSNVFILDSDSIVVNLPPGIYNISVTKDGYFTFVAERQLVNSDSSLEFILERM